MSIESQFDQLKALLPAVADELEALPEDERSNDYDSPLWSVLIRGILARQGEGEATGKKSSDVSEAASSALEVELPRTLMNLCENVDATLRVSAQNVSRAADEVKAQVLQLQSAKPVQVQTVAGGVVLKEKTRVVWFAPVAVCFALAVVLSAVVLFQGAAQLRAHYTAATEAALSRITESVITNRDTLARLARMNVGVLVRRDADGDGFHLVLKNVKKAAEPVRSPEGLSVQFWPQQENP